MSEQPSLLSPRPPPGPERIPLRDADTLILWRSWLVDHDEVFHELCDALPFEQHELGTPAGRIKAPRMECWCADEAGVPYTYSGETYRSARMADYPALCSVRFGVEAVTGWKFDAVFANLYRSGRDSIGLHADDEASLGPPAEVVIASLSLGQRRAFAIRNRTDVTERVRLDLGEGDLLLMGRRSQSAYLHEVPKTARPVSARLNLTFRRISCR